jgi:hypothetical protein
MIFSLLVSYIADLKQNELFFNLGVSLVSGSLVAIFVFVIQNLKDSRQKQGDDLLKAGIQEAYQNRALNEYDLLVPKANSIDVTGYSLKSFTEQNIDILVDRAKSKKPIQVRVLIVDPKSEASRIMEKAEGDAEGTYQNAYDSLMKKIGHIDGVEIRLLKRPISMMVYRIDNVLFTGYYPFTGRSRNAFTLKIIGGWIFKELTEDFQQLWKSSE